MIASDQVLKRPDASLTLAVLAVAAVALTMLLVHALVRRRAEKRITSYSRRRAAQSVTRGVAPAPVVPAPTTIDLTAGKGAASELDRIARPGAR